MKTFKIGLRTIKTTLAIILCAYMMKYIFHTSPFFACIGALVAVDCTIKDSLISILERNSGTLIGGLIGIVFTTLTDNIFFLGLGIIFVITILHSLKRQNAITPGCIVFLAVVYFAPNETAYLYGATRIMETFLGSIVGFLVNICIQKPKIS